MQIHKGITAQTVSYEVDGTSLLNNASFNIEAGLFTVLSGSNGSGKTTTLRLLSGDLRATSGSVKFHDRSIETWSVSDLAKFRAVLPQQSRLDFSFTVEQVVAMGREPFVVGNSAENNNEIVNAVIKACHVEAFKHRIYTSLSGGEKQRVQIARVLAQVWPEDNAAEKFVFLDEPVNQLDIKHQYIIMELLLELKQKGIGVCVVLHDLRLAQHYADHVVLLNQGQLVATGSFADVFNVDSLRDNFGITMEQAGLR